MEPERDAWELLQRVWMDEGPSLIRMPIGPVWIARSLGVEVLRSDELPADVSGVLRKGEGFTDAEIHLNALDSEVRRRFACAHALGHYSRNVEMRRHEAWEVVDGRDPFAAPISDAEETYAIEFAAELLMPRIALREFAESSGVAALAGFFGVPGDVMAFRLDQIGWSGR